MRGKQIQIDHDRVLTQYEAGLPIDEIARDNNCSIASVSRIAREHGILRKPDNTSSRDMDVEYFQCSTPERDHWLDFIEQYASFYADRNVISVYVPLAKLAELEKFRAAIGATEKKIYVTERYAQFQIANAAFVESVKHALNERVIP